MPEIFILHHRGDREIAAKVGEVLAEGGYNITYSEDAFKLGTEWQEYLKKYVSKCDIVLALVTGRSLQSETIFMATEIVSGYVLERGVGGVIPILIGADKLPVPLQGILALGGKDSTVEDISEDIITVVSLNIGKQTAKKEEIKKTRKEFDDTAYILALGVLILGLIIIVKGAPYL